MAEWILYHDWRSENQQKTEECNRKTSKLKLLCKTVFIIFSVALYKLWKHPTKWKSPGIFIILKMLQHMEKGSLYCPFKLFLRHSKPSHTYSPCTCTLTVLI